MMPIALILIPVLAFSTVLLIHQFATRALAEADPPAGREDGPVEQLKAA
jgi:hypothetical protein